MLPQSLVLIWLTVFSALVLVFSTWAVTVLPAGRIKTLFLAFLLPYAAWGESLLLIQLVGAEHSYSRPISQMIFMCGGFFHAALGLFFLEFSKPGSSNGVATRMLLGAVLAVSCLAPFGLLESGVKYSAADGLFPVEGPLFTVFNIILLAWGVFYMYRIRVAYKALPELSFVRVQLRFLAAPAMWAIGTTLLTNVVIPGLGGTFALTPLAAFWIFLFLVSVGYTVTQGKSLVLREGARRFDQIACSVATPSLIETADKFTKFVNPTIFTNPTTITNYSTAEGKPKLAQRKVLH